MVTAQENWADTYGIGCTPGNRSFTICYARTMAQNHKDRGYKGLTTVNLGYFDCLGRLEGNHPNLCYL